MRLPRAFSWLVLCPGEYEAVRNELGVPLQGGEWEVNRVRQCIAASGLTSGVSPSDGLRLLAFPSRSAARVWVDANHVSAAATLYTPYRAVPTLAWIAFRALGRNRWTSRALPSVALERTRADLVTLLSALMGASVTGVSISCGTPGPERKIVLQVQAGGRKLGFVKVADDEIPKKLIQNEYRMLVHGAASGLPGIPRVLFQHPVGETLMLGLGPIEGSQCPPRLLRSVRQVLERLTAGAHDRFEDTDVYARIDEAAAQDDRLMALWIPFRLTQRYRLVRRATVHGDCAPWNIRIANDTATFLDWEYGVARGFAGIDAAHYLLTYDLLRKGAQVGKRQAWLKGIWDAIRSIRAHEVVQSSDGLLFVLRCALLFDIAGALVSGSRDSQLTKRRYELYDILAAYEAT
jgi:hypothetical protein